jgi:glycogen(starch) synthase
MTRDLKVLLVGDYPPPYGGVSVQIAVLHRRLSKMEGFGSVVLDIGSSRRQKRSGCLPSRNVLEFCWNLARYAAGGYLVHLHTNGANWKSWMIAFVSGLAGILNGRRTIVSLGSGSAPEYVTGSTGLTRVLIWSAVRLATVIICRNHRMRLALSALGVRAGKLTVLAGFYGVDAQEIGAVPALVDEFLKRRTPVVGAIASVGPEYGIPLVAEVAAKLRAYYPDLGLVLVGAGGPDEPDESVCVTGEVPRSTALGIIRRLDVFVRPTYFDGDASSVREALALGVPVVASDTDFRPDGVIKFRRGDADDLAEKVIGALGTPAANRTIASSSGSLEQLLGIYQTVIQERMRS